jgi:hypothetical protein
MNSNQNLVLNLLTPIAMTKLILVKKNLLFYKIISLE